MSQKCYQFFINEKLKNLIYFFTCILPNYMPHEITKEFWENSHFQNMTACFLQRCQNSLRWEKLLICHWNIFSPAFYPIMCLMKSSKNFEKIVILKIWQPVFFWGVKTHFGEIPLKGCLFRSETFCFHPYCLSNSYGSH